MLSLSDFASGPVIAQAALVGVGSVMAWRGLHLSGDRGRYKLIWGTLCVGSFFCALLVGAWANHDSARSLENAQRDRQAALDRLGGIQATLKTIHLAMAKIANAANIDPNQSAQILAEKITKKLSGMENQIHQTDSRVEKIEHPPRNPDLPYQGGKVVAHLVKGSMFPGEKEFEFLEIYNANMIDFSKPIDFRGLVLMCQQHGLDAGISTSPIGMIENVMYNVMCSVVSGRL